ncbi:hypothetical protein KVY03_18375, partial [Epilithonimonas sp. FP105]|uniref:hypothetical protein n=1 Tax=Epilithonimonas sp. FP105 TaxID=2855443 RepID=UPI001C47C62C
MKKQTDFIKLNSCFLLIFYVMQFVSCQEKKYDNMTEAEKAAVQQEIYDRPSEIWPTNKNS